MSERLPTGSPLSVGAVLLAAGESRRMGSSKLRLPFGDSTILETSIQNLLAAGLETVVVVLGADPALADLVERHGEWAARVSVIRNPEYASGMLSSVRAGVASLELDRPFLVALADQPSIPSTVIRHLLERFETERPPVLRPRYRGKRGHPVIFDASLREALFALEPDATLRDLVHAYPNLEVTVETDDIHRDIDDPETYRIAMEGV